jgi:RNA polymerase sporulation-specific sigma factor
MHFRSQKKSAQDVSLSDYIETGADGAALSLMDVVAEEEDLMETVSRRESVRALCQAVKTCLTEQEKFSFTSQETVSEREITLRSKNGT